MLDFGDPVPEHIKQLAQHMLANIPSPWYAIRPDVNDCGVFRRPAKDGWKANSYVSYLEDSNNNCITITWGDVGQVSDIYPDIEDLT